MKKILSSLIILILTCNSLKAQDLITLNTGDQIKCKVVEIGVLEIKYKKQNTADATVYVIDKSTVFMINYEDGSKDVINEITNAPYKNETNSRKGIYLGLSNTNGFSTYYNPSETYGYYYGYGSFQSIQFKRIPTFSVDGGASFGIYFNNNLGLFTGLNFSHYGVIYKFEGYTFDEIKATRDISYFSIPITFSTTTGNPSSVNFYFEIGPQFGIWASGKYSQTGSRTTESSGNLNENNLFHKAQVFGNLSLGLNIPLNENKFSLNVGTYINCGLLNIDKSYPDNYSTTASAGIMIHFKTKLFQL